MHRSSRGSSRPSRHPRKENNIKRNNSDRRKPPKLSNTIPGRALNGAQKFASVASQAALVIGAVAVAGTIFGTKAASDGAQSAVDKASTEANQWKQNPTQKATDVYKQAEKSAVEITADFVVRGTAAATRAAGIATSTIYNVHHSVDQGLNSATDAMDQGVRTAKNAPSQALGSLNSAASDNTNKVKGFFRNVSEALGKIKRSLSEGSQSLNKNSREDNRDNQSARLSSLVAFYSNTAPQTFSDEVFEKRSTLAEKFRKILVSLGG